MGRPARRLVLPPRRPLPVPARHRGGRREPRRSLRGHPARFRGVARLHSVPTGHDHRAVHFHQAERAENLREPRLRRRLSRRVRAGGHRGHGTDDAGRPRLAPEPWPALREAVARQTERAVRDYSIAIQRPSTVAAAAIMIALEDVASDEDFARLTEALVGVVKEYPFETRCLFDTKAQLRFFLNDDVATGSERTEESAVEEEALHPDHHFHHRLVQDCLDRALSSPKLVICDDAWDASYATVY